MTNIDQLAETLKALSPRQLQKVLAVTPNKEGSKIRANRNARTEKYFSTAPKPHHFESFPQFREVVE